MPELMVRSNATISGEQWPTYPPAPPAHLRPEHRSIDRHRRLYNRSFSSSFGSSSSSSKCIKRTIILGALALVCITLVSVGRHIAVKIGSITRSSNKGLRRVSANVTTNIELESTDIILDPDKASRESTEATDRAAHAAAALVDTLDAARDAADELKRVAAAAAHKKRVADRAAAAAAAMAAKKAKMGPDGVTQIATVRERKIKLRDGSETSFSVFGRSDEDISVFVLPYDTKRKTFTLIEEYHPGPDTKMIGLVAGMFEPKHGGSPEKAAVWELSEEARLKMEDGTSQLISLAPEAKGGFSQDKYSSAHFLPFLALDCIKDGRPRPRDREEDITVHRDVNVNDLRVMLRDGRLNLPSTGFALMGLAWLEDKNLL